MLNDDEFSVLCNVATKPDVPAEVLEQLTGWKTMTMVLKEAGNVCFLSQGNGTLADPTIVWL